MVAAAQCATPAGGGVDRAGKAGTAGGTELVRKLRDGTAEERRQAASALAGERLHPTVAIPALISGLKDPDPRVRAECVRSLSKFQEAALPALVDVVACGGDPLVRRGAIRALRRIDDGGKVDAEALFAALRDRDSAVRREVIKYMTGKREKRFARQLGKAMRDDPDPELRVGAAIALSNYGPDASGAVRDLIAAAKEGGELGEIAESALIGIGKPVVPHLLRSMNAADRQERLVAQSVLAAMGPLAKPAVSAMASFLQDPDCEVRRCAASGLGKVGAGAAPAVPALVNLLNDKVAEVRFNAARALLRIDPGDTKGMPVLIKGLQAKEASVRLQAVLVIMSVGRRASDAVPSLIDLLSDNNEDVRLHSIYALGSIGTQALPAVGKLKEMRHDPAYVVRRAAEEALPRVQPRANDARGGKKE
jgi:HEAT repeat protein